MKRKTIIIITLALVVIAGAAWVYLNKNNNTLSYITATVTRGSIENTVTAVGNVEPSQFVDLGAQVSGQLKNLYVKIGDNVKKGQLLAEIDPTIYFAKAKQAETDLKNLAAQLTEKRSALFLSKQQYDRNDQLLNKKVIALADAEITEANYNIALAQVEALKAQLEQARAAIDIAKANLGYTKITTPNSGRVVSLSVVAGQTLNANQQTPVILRIASMDTMTVTAQVSEADIARLKIGQVVYFTTLGQTQKYYGKLTQILPTPTILNDVVLYNVLFNVENQNNTLMIGMTAQVFFIVEQSENTLLIPQSAIAYSLKTNVYKNPANQIDSENKKNMSVQVLNADGITTERKVITGISNAIYVEVLSGLDEGEKVIIGVESAEPTNTKGGLGANKKGGKL